VCLQDALGGVFYRKWRRGLLWFLRGGQCQPDSTVLQAKYFHFGCQLSEFFVDSTKHKPSMLENEKTDIDLAVPVL
jgi:hypothetical protein